MRTHRARAKDYMASFAPVTRDDVFADLGSGRGAVVAQARHELMSRIAVLHPMITGQNQKPWGTNRATPPL